MTAHGADVRFVAAALQAKRHRGERYSRHAPYGFKLTDAGRLEEDPAEKETVLLIAECRAAGYPFHAIAAELTRLNYQPRTVPTWTAANVRRLHQTFTKNREQ